MFSGPLVALTTAALAVTTFQAPAAPAQAKEKPHQAPAPTVLSAKEPPRSATVTGKGGAVTSVDPYASRIGLQVLKHGGNAVDAAIAAAATVALTEPCGNGLGSDCMAIVWDGARLHGLNAAGTAPAGWSADYFARKLVH